MVDSANPTGLCAGRRSRVKSAAHHPGWGFRGAFFEWRPTREAEFVGLENFIHYLLQYPESGREFANVARFLVYSLFAHVGMPFVMAELIFAIRSATTKELYRFLVVLPMLVPQIVAMLLWSRIYDPGLGPLNEFSDCRRP